MTEKLSNSRKNLYISIPFYFLAILPFVLLAYALGIELHVGYMLLGAVGWWMALMLRTPFILLITKLITDIKARNKYIIGLSGPTEEIVRLGLLLFIGLSTDNAVSVGIGWAGIEIIYALAQAFALTSLKGRTDAKALEAKVMLSKLGMDKTLDDTAVIWGALERVSASALHLSFSLLLVVSPWFVILTMIIHSAVNYTIVAINKQSIARAQIVLLTIATVLLVVALALV